MRTLKEWKVYLGRREKALEYFKSIPVKKIDLDSYFAPSDETAICDWKDLGIFPNKLKAGWKNHCTSVGCVAGWVASMPGVRRALSLHKQRGYVHFEAIATAYLGVDGAEGLIASNAFKARQEENISQKAEALKRLRALVSSAKAYIRTLSRA